MNVTYTVDLDMTEFQKYVKNVDQAYAQVGVLGGAGGKDVKTIAEYAVAHEFGSISHHLPRRSFLKDPLEKHLGDEIKSAKETLLKNLEAGNIKKAVAILGMKGVEIVKKAFETSNDGDWPDLSPATIAAMSEDRQKGWKILVDSGALQSSITSKVIVK